MAIFVIGTIKPKNNGAFPVIDAQDVAMPDGTRLPDYIDNLFVPVTQEEYDALVAADEDDDSKYYMIIGESE